MRPSDLGFSASRFPDFRRFSGFDQLAVARELAEAGERFQIANLPTGTGKSLLGCTAAHLRAGGAAKFLVLTATKALEDQYLSDGLVSARVHSHRNYKCAQYLQRNDDPDDPEFECAWSRSDCLHLAAVEAVRNARGSVTNYAYWLSIARWSDPDLLGMFDYLICDEAHEAAAWLVKALAIDITPGRLYRVLGLTRPEIPTFPTVDQYASWASLLHTQCLGRLQIVRERKEARKIERLAADLDQIRTISGSDLREPWIVIPIEETASSARGVRFSPRWGSDFSEQLLFRGIPSVLLMSATVTRDHARYLGIPDDKLRYREAPSPFDVRRRPIVYPKDDAVKVDYRMSQASKDKLHRTVDTIIEMAIDQRAGNGLIHTASYERNTELVKALRYAPTVITHERDSRDFAAQFTRFVEKGDRGEFAVFCSPRAQEGINLPDHRCRWQLILKAMPAFDSRDPLTKARMADPRYRNLVTAEVFKQACGRINRGDRDFGMTIVLDEHWGNHVRRNCPFEQWFRLAFSDLKDVSSLRFLTQEIVDGFGGQSANQAPPPVQLIFV